MLDQGQHREPIEGGLRIHLPANLAGRVADLSTAEQQCCAFFDFTLRLSADDLWLDVRAPDEAATLLAGVFGSIQPPYPRSDSLDGFRKGRSCSY